VKIDVAGFRDERMLDFDQIKGAGLASAFGLPMMSDFSSLIGGLSVHSPRPMAEHIQFRPRRRIATALKWPAACNGCI